MKWKTLLLAVVLGGLLLAAGATGMTAEPEGGPWRGRHGPSFGAFGQFDTVLLAGDGLISGKVLTEQFTMDVPAIGRAVTLTKDQIAWFLLGRDGNDEVVLRTGDRLRGRLQIENVRVDLVIGGATNLTRAQLAGVVFARRDQGPGRGPRGDFFGSPLFQFLRRAGTQWDLVTLSDGGLVSANVLTEKFSFQSTTLGAFTFDKAAVAAIMIGVSQREPRDVIVLRTGDRLIGVLQTAEFSIQTTLGTQATLKKEQLRAIAFKGVGRRGR